MVRFASTSRGVAPFLILGLTFLHSPQSLAQTSAQPHAAFTARGVVEPADGVLSIGTAATGVIERIVAGPGAAVHAGDELIKIDCAPLEADVKALAGQAQAAQAVDERVRNGSRPQEIAVGEANVGVARARAEEAAEALRRAQALQLGISVTQAVMLQVERDARITSAQLEDARARLDLLRSGSREEDVAEADARRDAAAAALDATRARLAECTVRSPADGVVVERLASRGQFVTSAVPSVLLRLANDKNLRHSRRGRGGASFRSLRPPARFDRTARRNGRRARGKPRPRRPAHRSLVAGRASTRRDATCPYGRVLDV